MALSNFVPYDKKESFLLNIAKFNLEIVENTYSKPQETLEFKKNKQSEYFSFEFPLILEDSWLMGVTNLQVNKTVYNITKSNNTLIVRLNGEQLEELRVDTKLVEKIRNLYETADTIIAETVKKNAENLQKLLNESYDKEILQQDYEEIKSIVESVKLYPNPPEIKIPSFKIIAYIHFQIYLTPGIYEIKEINECIQELIKKDIISLSAPLKFTVEADTTTMKSIIKLSNPFFLFQVRFYRKKLFIWYT